MLGDRGLSLPRELKETLEKKLRGEADRSLKEALGRLEVKHKSCEEKLERKADELVREFVSKIK